jgi:serine/threonine protein phosphatase 1
MNKYFVVSDVHSYLTPLKTALKEKGYNKHDKHHYLIVCGDIFDRGNETKELLNYLLSIPKKRLILIRGNHEDLLELCIDCLDTPQQTNIHLHINNGTFKTLMQLTKMIYPLEYVGKAKQIRRKLKRYYKLVNRCVDYYELGKYVFVHGWIPNKNYQYCTKKEWGKARWYNGIQYANEGFIIPNKIVVCGHYHTSYGNYNFHKIGDGEFTKNACFDIYKNDGIIAIDGDVAHTNKINVLVIDGGDVNGN